jgi:hypothetical protein
MMTKKNILLMSGVLSVIALSLNYIGTDVLCSWFGGDTACMRQWASFIMNFLPIFPLFFFSLLTYKMREEIYQSWFRFARWWTPLSMFLILIMPSDTGGGGFGPQISLGKGDVALVTSFFFVLISGILIAYKSFTLKKGGAGK